MRTHAPRRFLDACEGHVGGLSESRARPPPHPIGPSGEPVLRATDRRTCLYGRREWAMGRPRRPPRRTT